MRVQLGCVDGYGLLESSLSSVHALCNYQEMVTNLLKRFPYEITNNAWLFHTIDPRTKSRSECWSTEYGKGTPFDIMNACWELLLPMCCVMVPVLPKCCKISPNANSPGICHAKCLKNVLIVGLWILPPPRTFVSKSRARVRPVLTPTSVSWAWGPYQNDRTRPSRSLKRTHLKANTRSLPRVNFHGWPQTMARSHTPAAPQTATTYSQKAGRKTLKLKYTGAMQVFFVRYSMKISYEQFTHLHMFRFIHIFLSHTHSFIPIHHNFLTHTILSAILELVLHSFRFSITTQTPKCLGICSYQCDYWSFQLNLFKQAGWQLRAPCLTTCWLKIKSCCWPQEHSETVLSNTSYNFWKISTLHHLLCLSCLPCLDWTTVSDYWTKQCDFWGYSVFCFDMQTRVLHNSYGVGVHGQLVPLHILCWTLRVPQYFRGFGATKTLWV